MRLTQILQYLKQILAFVIIFLHAGLRLPPVCLHFSTYKVFRPTAATESPPRIWTELVWSRLPQKRSFPLPRQQGLDLGDRL